ncbi:MAG: NAD(P)-binding domain-containing protein, partial [Simkaniaceae bacterium]|nr:NAD(P)-binding domain-containing protein [Simkaniaceae bacterium]
MKICVLGAGAWGFCLATVLAENGHQVILWAKDGELIDSLAKGEKHPKLKAYAAHPSIRFAKQLEEGVQGVDLIVESVTSQGVRPVLQALRKNKVPLVITSKGIEEGTGLLLTEVAKEVLGSTQIGCLSGPSLAEEVMRKLPTSIVCSSYENEIMELIKTAFSSPYFRVYP